MIDRNRLTAALALIALLPATAAVAKRTDTVLPMPPAPVQEVVQPASGPAQTLAPGAALSSHWWEAFGSPALNALVTTALTRNNDIATAEANLRQASELAKAAGGALAPQLDAGFTSERQHTSGTLANNLRDPAKYLYTLHTAQLSVTYPLDVFGGLRSQRASAAAKADMMAHQADAARSMVAANLVTAVIAHASLTDQITAAQDSIANGRQILQLMQRRRELGDIGDADVAAQQTAIATAEGSIPPLLRDRVHQERLIAILLGQAPGAPLPDLPSLADLSLPGTVPVALPADLVANRPDVQAAAAQLRSAGADVGTAIAARLPSITLNASVGSATDGLASLFAGGTGFWTLLGGITQPLFHGRQLLHQQKAAEAALDAAKAQYRDAALQAFGDVSEALAALRTDGVALDAATRASEAAQRSLTYTQTQLRLGGVGTLALLNASNSALQANGQLIQAKAARLTDTVAMFQSVGGKVQL